MMKVEIKGIEAVQQIVNQLPEQFQDKILKETHKKAVQPLIERAHLLAPVYETGNLAESIGVVTAKSDVTGNRSELGLINVGPRRKGRFKGYHGHMVEFGTKVRRDKRGANRGKVDPEPFMEPAWEQTKDIVMKNNENEMAKVVLRFFKSILKKNRA